jgi:hypothetical protein
MVIASAGGAWAEVHECGAGVVIWAIGCIADTSVGAWFRLRYSERRVC